MSEKNEAGLNELDMQAVIAAWIIANDDCAGVSCSGGGGYFKGTECPMIARYGIFDRYGICSAVDGLDSVRQWLKKHNQQEAEAAEAEKRESEAVKNEEQEAKKTCGACQCAFGADGVLDIVTPGVVFCHKKSVRVPIEFAGCRDFESVATDRMTLQCQDSASECSDDFAAYAERIAQLEAENARLTKEIARCKEDMRLSGEGWKAIVKVVKAAYIERIARLEKEKAELLEGRTSYRTAQQAV